MYKKMLILYHRGTVGRCNSVNAGIQFCKSRRILSPHLSAQSCCSELFAVNEYISKRCLNYTSHSSLFYLIGFAVALVIIKAFLCGSDTHTYTHFDYSIVPLSNVQTNNLSKVYPFFPLWVKSGKESVNLWCRTGFSLHISFRWYLWSKRHMLFVCFLCTSDLAVTWRVYECPIVVA